MRAFLAEVNTEQGWGAGRTQAGLSVKYWGFMGNPCVGITARVGDVWPELTLREEAPGELVQSRSEDDSAVAEGRLYVRAALRGGRTLGRVGNRWVGVARAPGP